MNVEERCMSETDWQWRSGWAMSLLPAVDPTRRQSGVRTDSPCCPPRRACSDTSDPSFPETPICWSDSDSFLLPNSVNIRVTSVECKMTSDVSCSSLRVLPACASPSFYGSCFHALSKPMISSVVVADLIIL